MTRKRNPVAGAQPAHGISEVDQLGGKVVSETNLSTIAKQAPIRAVLIGTDRCGAEGLSVRTNAPVLALCRKLVASGIDPQRPLHAYRGEMLCLRVRSLAEAARLKINSKGTNFA